MGKVGDYYSIKEADKEAKDRRYHNNDRCGPGSEIPQHNKRYGNPNNDKLCEHCADLN
jgi:ribosomal protein S27AE